MTPGSAPAPCEAAAVACALFIVLVPFAGAGLALINTGLGRSRSAAHSMLASLLVLAAAAVAYFVCGFAWQGYPGCASHGIILEGKAWSWIAAEPMFFRALEFGATPASLAAWLGLVSAGLAALIPLGAGAERWRLGAVCASAALVAGAVYPLFAHWVWGGGWLAQLGTNYGIGLGFLDPGGAGAIQAVGGLTALSISWTLGPRRGKYSFEGNPTAIPGHNIIFVLLGCFLALVGWLGLNAAGAILHNGAGAGRLALCGMNTMLAAAAAALASAFVTRLRFGKPDASLTANGWVSGLVASSAVCAIASPAAAVVIGLAAGTLVVLAVELLETRLGVDDPGGAIAVHGVGGIWGVLAVGLFAGAAGQGLAQLVGVASLLGFVLPASYGLNRLLNRFVPFRISAEGERQGLDLSEIGAGAYPEFVTHTDEFIPR